LEIPDALRDGSHLLGPGTVLVCKVGYSRHFPVPPIASAPQNHFAKIDDGQKDTAGEFLIGADLSGFTVRFDASDAPGAAPQLHRFPVNKLLRLGERLLIVIQFKFFREPCDVVRLVQPV
jgi:hypothetical protein